MVESNLPETAPAPANLVMEEFCTYAASSWTAEDSGDISHACANARPDKCTVWTDEKHNKYLGSLEASFIQQLHRSIGFVAWCTEQKRSGKDSSHRLPTSASKASEQFTVLRDGQQQKTIYEKNQPLSYISTIKIPRMCCQRHAGKDSAHGSADPKQCNELHCEEGHLERKRAFSSGSASRSGVNHISNPCYDNSVIKEGWGQNFADEDCEHNSNTFSLAKRLKTAVDDYSIEDQTVPSGKFFALGKSIINNTTLDGQANNEDLQKILITGPLSIGREV